MRRLGDLRRLLVADVRVERRHQHQRFVEVLLDPREVGLDAGRTVNAHRIAGVGNQVGRFEHVVHHQRLEDVELEVTLGAGKGHRGVVAEHLDADHRHRLALRGVYLARHDRTARLILRDRDLADPAPRPRGQQADVVGDLEQRDREASFRRAHLHHGVVGCEGRELVGGRHERMAGLLRDVLRRHVAEPGVGIQARAHGRAADREFIEPRQRPLDALDPVIELGPPARDLLAERDRGGILKMRATDLHEVGMLLFERQKHVAELPHRRQESVVDHLHGGDMHRGREGVVRRLAAVDVVVGMHRLLRSHHAAGDLDRAVGDHLVGVHVRLRAAAGLEHDQRKVVVELSGDHLVGRLHDQLHGGGRKLPQFAVGERRALLEHAERLFDRPAPLEAFRADLEVVAGPLGLGAPVAVGGDVDLAHAVGFDAERVRISVHDGLWCGVDGRGRWKTRIVRPDAQEFNGA